MILATALVLRIFVRTSDMEFILCLNLIQFNWGTHCFSSLLQHLPLVYSFKRSCKKYKKCKNTKCEKTKRKLTVSWFIFLLCLYRLKDTAIMQVMKVMKTSFLSHRPQPLPPKQHVILYIVKHFWRVYSYCPPWCRALSGQGGLWAFVTNQAMMVGAYDSGRWCRIALRERGQTKQLCLFSTIPNINPSWHHT